MTKLQPVQSSNISDIGHDSDNDELHVKFHNGATHIYSGVTAEKHQALVAADSIGSHFHHNIRAQHNSRKA